jgi:hypothetical protein
MLSSFRPKESERPSSLAVKTVVTIDPTLKDQALDQKIWRYMKLEQLLAIMQCDSKGNRTLHFSPLSRMQDLSERRLSRVAVERIVQKLPSHVTGDKANVVAGMDDRWRQDMCISSWCMCSYQSAAMWSLYATDRGVAIESTVRQLQQCFTDLQDFPMGVTIEPVRYYSAEQAERYVEEQVWGSRSIKWESFGYEHELGAVICCQNRGLGADVPIDPSVLIHRLHVSPEAEDWVVCVIRDAVKQYKYDFPVDKASLDVLR